MDFPVIEQLPWSVILLLVIGVASVLLMRSDFGRQLSPWATTNEPPACRACAWTACGPGLRPLGPLAAVAGILLGGFGGSRPRSARASSSTRSPPSCWAGSCSVAAVDRSWPRWPARSLWRRCSRWLNLQGVSGALEDTVQGVIIIAAVAFAATGSGARDDGVAHQTEEEQG